MVVMVAAGAFVHRLRLGVGRPRRSRTNRIFPLVVRLRNPCCRSASSPFRRGRSVAASLRWMRRMARPPVVATGSAGSSSSSRWSWLKKSIKRTSGVGSSNDVSRSNRSWTSLRVVHADSTFTPSQRLFSRRALVSRLAMNLVRGSFFIMFDVARWE